jgi:hypothetical protein
LNYAIQRQTLQNASPVLNPVRLNLELRASLIEEHNLYMHCRGEKTLFKMEAVCQKNILYLY